ncbi:transglycosylase family protein [Streptomyces sp. NPDC002328]|uniref:transglycosylase family protein n=1 Tax=Streptomyces sp. NPDC002328 TaxID=3364642 RepID=UPI00367C6802
MLSGNGRHRRPRQAPALLVAAGVTGSAIAIPLLGASGASAADGTVWDRVAECETGGSWSADQGGGEYGGLALSQDDWDKYGGADYASRPDLASRNQQIAVAQKVLADQGVGAWGTCGLTSGLTADAASGSVDTGVADDQSDSSISSGLSDLSRGSGSSNSSGSSRDSGSASTDPSAGSSADSGDSSSSSPSSTPSSPSSSSSAADSEEGGSAKPDDPAGAAGSQAGGSSPTESPKLDESDNSAQGAGSWSLVDTGSLAADAETLGADTLGSGRHRGSTADESATGGDSAASPGRHAANSLSGAAGTYVVQDGDSLESIADSLGVDGGWRALYDGNKDVIGADPSDITPGQTLTTGAE